jgi:hypothetical protein
MKQLLLALLAASVAIVYAETTVVETSKDTKDTTTTTTVHTFDQSQMKCGSRKLKDSSKVSGCKIQPKEAGDDKHTVRFIDDNSGKKVKCEVSKKGTLVLAQCVSTD